MAIYYLLGASAWIFLSDLAMSELTRDLQTQVAYGIVKGTLFVLVTTGLLYWILSVQPVAPAPAPAGTTGGFWRTPLAAFAATGLVVLLTAILMFTLESRQVRDAARSRLAATLELKADQVDLWLAGKRAVALSLRGARGMREQVEILARRDDPVVRAALAARLEDIRRNLGIDAALVLGPRARLLAAAGDARYRALSPKLLADVAAAARSGESVIGYIHRIPEGDGEHVVIDDLDPLTGAASADPRPGVLVLRENARTRFFGMVGDLPGAGESAEALLVRRDGDQVQYLSDLRFRKDSELRFTQPLNDANLTAAMALKGAQLVDGKDYRGVEVVAAARAIPGTDWFLVAKVDRSEILSQVRRSVAGWLLAVAGIAALAALGVVALWREQRTVAALRERALATERAALEKHLDYLSRYANDMILLIDPANRIVAANDRAVERYGYPREQLLRMSAADLRVPADRAQAATRHAEVQQKGSLLYEAVHQSAAGEAFPVEISARRVHAGGMIYIQSINRDISERRNAEARIRRLSQTRDALSAINRAIVHASDEAALCLETCRIAVEHAGFIHAWIGVAEPGSGLIAPVASAGPLAEYLAQIRVSVRDEPEGRGPTGTAAREMRRILCNDFLADATTAPWQEQARRYGIRSSAAFPIRRPDGKLSVLSVYAASTGFFDAEIAALLEEMAGDLSFALGNLARNRELRESEARFRAMLEQSVAAIFVIQDGRFTYANPRLRELLGSGPDDPFEPDALAHVAPPDRAMMAEAIAGWLKGEATAPGSFLALRRGDRPFRLGVSMQRATYAGRPAIIGIGQDITEKERAQAERDDRLRRAEAHLAALTALTGSARLNGGEVEEFARELTEAAARAAGVERANVWLFNDAESELRCIDLYEATPARHSSGATLTQARFGAEFAALKSAAYVDANEPLTDARTAGYAESYLKPLRITSMLDAVVRFSGQNLGLLCLEHVDRAHRWHTDEIAFACQLADKLALAIVNRRRHKARRKLRRSLEDSIQAIAATVEMRDPYTAGHERRVADLGAAIATEMGLPPSVVEGIHFGGLIHDLGKIQVPAEILSKPTRLQPVEFELIKGHAQAGFEILKGIDFPWPVAEMARQHHERADGSGYPQGLKGESILLEARVLAVADVVEAMASHRPYRPGLGVDKALAEIERGRGTAYDPAVADACLRLFREKSYAIPD